MTIAISSDELGLKSVAATALKTSAGFWFLVAAAGQWLFFYYIAAFYGPSTLSGNFQIWTRNHALLKGYIPGDMAGNLAFGVHALMAGFVAASGALQLIPQIRTYAPSFHRWNGRAFLATALGISVTGLYMVWVRGAATNLTGAVGISGNAAFIILFAGLAWRTAVRRDFAAHRLWALRTFLVANGQWFFRVGIFGWILANQGPVGLGKNFDGPVVVFWEFGCYLVPLAILELYLRVRKSPDSRGRIIMAGALALLALFLCAGIFGVYMFMWRPVLGRI